MQQHDDKTKYMALRAVRANHIGQLVSIKAMVARCSDVKPLAKVVTYTCEECGYETYQEVTGRSFMPLDKCKSPVCVQYNNNNKLLMQSRGSKFSKFQELKIQELPSQVPTGHIPRMMTVHLMGELTRTAAPGDEIEVSGIFLPTPYTGKTKHAEDQARRIASCARPRASRVRRASRCCARECRMFLRVCPAASSVSVRRGALTVWVCGCVHVCERVPSCVPGGGGTGSRISGHEGGADCRHLPRGHLGAPDQRALSRLPVLG